MLCKLPPYPKRGGYVVLGAESAGPGDVLSEVSLVQYTTDRSNEVFEIKRLTCTSGEWEQDIFEYDGKALYFYTNWCPYFCTSFLSEQWTDCSPPNIDRDAKVVQQSRLLIDKKRSEPKNTTSQFCRLPPYPSRGTYVVQDNPDAGPGDTFQNVSLIQYTSDEHNKVVTIEHFRCLSGVWYQKIFQEASENLYFYSSWCPKLCSQCFGEKLADRQHSLLSKNQALTKKDQPKTKAGYCAVPPYPEFGSYSVIGEPTAAQPGDEYDALWLNYTCGAGYSLVGSGILYCLRGVWSDELPKCTRFCPLIRQPGVEYLCGQVGSDDDLRPCGAQAQDGSVVIPRCSSPYYQAKSALRPMICQHEEWDHVPDCSPG
ncbi:hypothetical protein EVAR_5219_1 [Eumeta japonica]|uniref:Sushi domain-containing protein n=1 Tax=Eumeta variegata TaxID=151549 RepID=A0A4C1V5H6_EUMVA|nr:hypothetical protein EVAR_5219_1 [Eumeta japonica]